MTRYLFAFVLMMPGAMASAEEMQVRAGEHGEFTRVVLAFDALPNWQAGRTDGGYAVTLDGYAPLITDTSRLFALIGRDRIARVDVDRTKRRIDLALACDCHAEIFALNNIRLVIDVRDGASGPRATHEGRLNDNSSVGDVVEGGSADDGVAIPDMPTLSPPPPLELQNIFGGRPDTSVMRSSRPALLTTSGLAQTFAPGISQGSASTDESTTVFDVSPFAPLPTIGPLPTVNTTAIDAVSQQLSRAVSQGLVDVTASSDAPASGSLPVTGPRNFRTFTSLDRDTGMLDDQAGATDRGSGCLPDRLVNVGNWGDSAGAKELAQLRKAVVLESGALDSEAMLALARYYVLLGFGAEARFAAKGLPDTAERRAILALSEIVDQGGSASPMFEGQLACPGQVAFWAALARPFDRAELPVSTDKILTSFSALPPHLREHLGPVLSQRLRAAGETALARAALAAVTRIGPGSIGLELTAARLELRGTRAEEAREELERIAQGTNIEAAEALIELLKDADRRRVAPKPSWIDDADTLVRATKGTQVADMLSFAALRGHIPLGRFDDLRRALGAGRPGLTDTLRRDLAVEALSAAVTDADDETFLRAELGLTDIAKPDMLDTSVRYAFVGRFLDLGLPRLSAKYLPTTMESEDELRLGAATLISLERRADALALLSDAEAPILKKMQADVLARLGKFPDAARLFADLGDIEAAELQALRSGDWRWIAENGPSSLSGLADVVTANAPGQNDGNATLIGNITQRRAAYGDLLRRTQPVVVE